MNGSLAGDARDCLLAAIRAANPRELTANALRSRHADAGPLPVQVIAVGKAAHGMVLGAIDVLGAAIVGGIVIAPEPVTALGTGFRSFAGGHPTPNADGARGARAIASTLRDAGPGGRLLVLLSGGASALMTLPADGLALEEVAATSGALMAAGADIRELNCVRKHLDQLKGGLMARVAAGARIRALVLSDVIGDPLDVIASGPLVPDSTTYADAIAVLKRRGVWNALPQPVYGHLIAGAGGEQRETPKIGDPLFVNVEIEVIGNNALAVQGAAAEARRLGYEVEFVAGPIAGEAREAGATFAHHSLETRAFHGRGRPHCLVGGGETTVTVRGSGIGGRNLEFAAAAALVVDGSSGVAIGSVGTDGRDGPTDAAGAVVDGATASVARAAHMALDERLRDNDALRALDSAGAVIRTGATGTNVMDVCIAMLAPA